MSKETYIKGLDPDTISFRDLINQDRKYVSAVVRTLKKRVESMGQSKKRAGFTYNPGNLIRSTKGMSKNDLIMYASELKGETRSPEFTVRGRRTVTEKMVKESIREVYGAGIFKDTGLAVYYDKATGQWMSKDSNGVETPIFTNREANQLFEQFKDWKAHTGVDRGTQGSAEMFRDIAKEFIKAKAGEKMNAVRDMIERKTRSNLASGHAVAEDLPI